MKQNSETKYITYHNMFWLFMMGNVLGVILEGNKFIKIYLSTDMRKKVIDFHISVDFFLDKLV